jgi:diguanylate cyclase (GGDEF)-like protein
MNNYGERVRMLNESSGISVLLVNAQDDDLAAVNRALRDGGHAVHCTRVDRLSILEDAITTRAPELLLLIAADPFSELAQTAKIRDTADPYLPLLLLTTTVDEDTISKAMKMGARDVVCLAKPERLCAVADRELRARRVESALESVMGSARQYKHELNSLKQLTHEAIADIQEGIIVQANPAWLELFGLDEDSDLTGYPIMDLCAEASRPALKGGLVACQRGRWSDSKLRIKGVRQDDSQFAVALNLETIKHDGEAAVRILVSPEQTEDQTPQLLIEQALQRDQVTGFFNRNHFINVVESRLAKPPAGGVRAVAYIRPDRFSKAINDIGLMGTESVIAQLSEILREFIQPTDIYGRFGGTMFSIMLERGTMADVNAWANQLLQAINNAVFDHDDHTTVITCTIGLCEADGAKLSAIKLMSDAERACTTARMAGGDRIELSESSGAAKKSRQDDTIWVPKIRGALMENRLRLEHQPIGGLNRDIDNAFDTLVRMLDDEGNTILPSEFMPIAERTGLTKNIDRWIIGASLSFCATSNAQLVFVRLSRDSLMDETLPEWLNSQTEQAGVQPSRLCFEVAEDVVAKHLRQAKKTANWLRASGFRFAVEHFGKLDDSSRIIKHVPMEFVKIDGSLMQGLHKNPDVQNQVEELARQARENNIITVAERVQDANTMAVLWQLGIDYIQGNYLQTQEIVLEDTSHSGVTTMALRSQSEEETEVPA